MILETKYEKKFNEYLLYKGGKYKNKVKIYITDDMPVYEKRYSGRYSTIAEVIATRDAISCCESFGFKVEYDYDLEVAPNCGKHGLRVSVSKKSKRTKMYKQLMLWYAKQEGHHE